MEWTTEKPTKPGWYWWRNPNIHGSLEVVEVMVKMDGSVVGTNFWLGRFPIDNNGLREWAGPVPEPTERTEGV